MSALVNGHTATFAGALTKARLAAGCSQAGLGRATGYDRSYISRIEAGKREPSRETVMALASALGLEPHERTYSDLLRAAGYWPANPIMAAFIALDELVVAPLPPDMQRLVVRLARDLLADAIDGAHN